VQIKDKVPSVEAAVLYGSMARGDYDRRSDIDIMLVVGSVNIQELYPLASQVITGLRPHREIKVVITNLHDYDEDFYQNVFREGKVLFGKVILTPEQLALEPYSLVSYDLSNKPNTIQVKVSKRVHGSTSKKVIGGKEKVYTYPGLEESMGGKIVSKSAVLLPFGKYNEFTDELKQLGVPFRLLKLWM